MEPLKVVEPLTRNRGSLFEGDIFSVLKHSPFVVRSFEFALADGAIDCSFDYSPQSSYADRFYDVEHRHFIPEESSELVLFDVKSSVDDNMFVTSVKQRRQVAFYIGVYAGDTRFVDLMPNLHQDVLETSYGPSSPSGMQDDIGPPTDAADRNVTVATHRTARLRKQAFGINQSNAPYRMPLSMLNEAIHRIRDCVRKGRAYMNPWTKVAFPKWRPRTTRANRHLKPEEGTEHFSAYDAAIDIYRVVKFHSSDTEMEVDFVGLQPRLADFKLILRDKTSSQDSTSRGLRQVYVQHKLDPSRRAANSSLHRVAVARGEDKKRGYYFSAFDRFDFLFYQFTFSDLLNVRPRVEFFFLPERVLPDLFFTTLERYVSFDECPDFSKYRIHMDSAGDWVLKMQRVVEETEHPRKPFRPLRTLPTTDLTASTQDNVADMIVSTRQRTPGAGPKRHGKHDWAEIMRYGHQRFFDMIMQQCASRKSGLLVLLATGHPVGDFAYCRYRWTQQEAERFNTSARPPCTTQSLPADTPLTAISYYIRDLECAYQGPNITPAQFRRLNSCVLARLVVWDLSGPDSGRQPPMVSVIPSDDMSFSERQRQLFAKNLKKNKDDEFFEKMPSLSAALDRGMFAGQYGGSLGPLANDTRDWGQMWRLLDMFSSVESFEHPRGAIRQPAIYRHTLQTIHQQLGNEYINSTAS